MLTSKPTLPGPTARRGETRPVGEAVPPRERLTPSTAGRTFLSALPNPGRQECPPHQTRTVSPRRGRHSACLWTRTPSGRSLRGEPGLSWAVAEARPAGCLMREAFEQAILEAPDDVAAYSAFADWLIEHGDPQGEFVRVQLALEDESLDKDQRAGLKRREMELLARHNRDWLGPLAAA